MTHNEHEFDSLSWARWALLGSDTSPVPSTLAFMVDRIDQAITRARWYLRKELKAAAAAPSPMPVVSIVTTPSAFIRAGEEVMQQIREQQDRKTQDAAVLETFGQEMTEHAVPEIVQAVENRQQLAADARQRRLEQPTPDTWESIKADYQAAIREHYRRLHALRAACTHPPEQQSGWLLGNGYEAQFCDLCHATTDRRPLQPPTLTREVCDVD
jgi:hypothetical protein